MNSINNPTFENLGLALNPSVSKSSKLGQEQFLELMVAQLKNQDPTKPLQSGEFLGQLAQFGTVNGIQELQASFGEMSTALRSNQALMASGLVGRTVLAPGGVGTLPAGGSLAGSMSLASSASNVVVTINDAAGQLVKRIDLGSQKAGEVSFSWNGMTDNGTAAAPGRYAIKAQAFSGTESYAVDTFVLSRVDSVSLGGSQGLMLNLSGLGAVPVTDVKQIY